MTLIAKQEVDALRAAGDEFERVFDKISIGQEFDDAYVTFLQSYRRILLICEDQRSMQASGTELHDEVTGNSCSRCLSLNLIRKGGCVTCRDCKYSEGCGG